MSTGNIDCPKCGVRLVVNVRGMGVPGGQEREEGSCPLCHEIVHSEMTDGFIFVDLNPDDHAGLFFISNPLTGRPKKMTGGSPDIEKARFSSEEKREKFIDLFFPSAVIAIDVPVRD